MGTGFHLPGNGTITYATIVAAGKKHTGIASASVTIVDIPPGILRVVLVITHFRDFFPDFFLFIRIGFPRGPINGAAVTGKPTVRDKIPGFHQ